MSERQRKPIGKTLRFEVFKRDKFTCQYCGRSAPEIVLQADHIKPVAKEGDNDILNLITSCVDCNSGKRDRELSDDTVVRKQKAQLDELQERREQIEMMLSWQRGLVGLRDDAVESAISFWNEIVTPCSLTEYGIEGVRTMVKRYGLQLVLESMREATDAYLTRENDAPAIDSVNKAFDYTERICAAKKASEKEPYMRDLYYIRGIVKRRVVYFNSWLAMQLLKRAVRAGADIEELSELAKDTRNWSGWHRAMNELIDAYERSDQG